MTNALGFAVALTSLQQLERNPAPPPSLEGERHPQRAERIHCAHDFQSTQPDRAHANLLNQPFHLRASVTFRAAVEHIHLRLAELRLSENIPAQRVERAKDDGCGHGPGDGRHVVDERPAKVVCCINAGGIPHAKEDRVTGGGPLFTECAANVARPQNRNIHGSLSSTGPIFLVRGAKVWMAAILFQFLLSRKLAVRRQNIQNLLIGLDESCVVTMRASNSPRPGPSIRPCPHMPTASK